MADMHPHMIARNDTNSFHDETLELSVGILGPFDPSAPELEKSKTAPGTKAYPAS
jgi:hypothetical protein